MALCCVFFHWLIDTFLFLFYYFILKVKLHGSELTYNKMHLFLLESFLRCVHLFKSITNKIQSISITTWSSLAPIWRQSHFAHKAPWNCESALCHHTSLIFSRLYKNGVMQYVLFCVCFLWLRFPRVICAVTCVSRPFLFIAEQYSPVWIHPSLFICSPVKRHVGCFWLLWRKLLWTLLF